MIRSHSISGDLHGVQPDPISADILRKEPEQETFVRLKISPSGTSPFIHDFQQTMYFFFLFTHYLRLSYGIFGIG